MKEETFPLVGYVLLFTAIPVGFIFVHLLAGKLIRPFRPHAEKGTVYECGEPTIGSAWVQFDLRYYVVALLFVIFDVEVAFFFPWAIVFGQVNDVARVEKVPATAEERADYDRRKAENFKKWDEEKQTAPKGKEPLYPPPTTWPKAEPGQTPSDSERERLTYAENLNALSAKPKDANLASTTKPVAAEELTDLNVGQYSSRARSFGLIALLDILVFFGVILLGFAYLWKRGDLAWVKTTATGAMPPPPPPEVSLAPPPPAPSHEKELVLPVAH